MASTIKVDTIQSTTSNVFFQNSAGTEYARFDASGNMGIGAASPSTTTKFYVEQSGGGNVLGYFNSTATAQNARLRINSTDNASSVAYVWSYSHASLNKQLSAYLTSTGALAIQAGQTAGSEPTSGTTSAIFNQYGIGLGGTSPSSGAGIAFPATQSASSDANTLDDYEEGTFTPTITGTTTAGSASYSTQSGSYVKIGKYVFVQLFIVFTSAHTGTGGTKVGGFPFTIGSNYGHGGTITYKTSWVTNGPDFMQGEANTTFGYLRYDNNTLHADINPNVNIQNATGFMLSIWYISDN